MESSAPGGIPTLFVMENSLAILVCHKLVPCQLVWHNVANALIEAVSYYKMFWVAILFWLLLSFSGTSASASDNDVKLFRPESSTECAMPWSCCDQNPGILHGILHCGKDKTWSVLYSFCATINEWNILEVGHCLYNFIVLNDNSVYRDFPKNNSVLSDFMCEDLHRTGTLCGKCQDGYYPLAYSYDMKCVQCPNGKSNWWKFVLAAFLPLTIFYIFILFFKVNVVSSRFQGFLFYSQIISWPTTVRVLFLSTHSKVGNAAVPYLATLYGIWNLDFFRSINFSICLGTDTLQTLVLDLIVGAYPLLLMVVSYVLIELYDRNFRPLVIVWIPFRRLFGLFWENWDLRTSLVDAFITAFLLTDQCQVPECVL